MRAILAHRPSRGQSLRREFLWIAAARALTVRKKISPNRAARLGPSFETGNPIQHALEPLRQPRNQGAGAAILNERF
jgi:hypothetical protein